MKILKKVVHVNKPRVCTTHIPYNVPIAGNPYGNLDQECVFCGKIITKEKDGVGEHGRLQYVRLFIHGIGWKIWNVHYACYYEMYKISEDLIDQDRDTFAVELL